SISAISSKLVTIDNISSEFNAGIAACRSGSIFIDIVPPVKIITTLFFIKRPPYYVWIKFNIILHKKKCFWEGAFHPVLDGTNRSKGVLGIEILFKGYQGDNLVDKL